MDREIYSIKGNPRHGRKAPGGELEVCHLTLVKRRRLSPMNNVSCGNQPANISLTERRVKFPCSFHYLILFFRHLLM
jgi:hypothetical protein